MSESKILSTGAANVVLEIEIDAPVSTTWNAMIQDIGQWWRRDFLICENSTGMTLEPHVGGLLLERAGDDGCGYAWGSIISFQPESHLGYVAQIVPPFGGPAQSVVQIALETLENDRTKLTLTDSIIGHVTDDLFSCLEDGWRMLYADGGLKTYVESLG